MPTAALAGRVALVTGAGRNLGRAIALLLARNGAEVVVNVRSSAAEAESVAEEARRLGVRALPYACDVADPDAVAAMFEATVVTLGRSPDILVNNAGLRHRERFVDLTTAHWREVMSVALDGAFFCSKSAVPSMIENGWGRIINIAGQAGFAGQLDMAHVVAAKAGLHGLTKALARELGPDGITVNTVSPGLISTGSSMRPDQLRAREATLPVRKIPDSDDVATVCEFLATEPGFVTGQAIHVNGGEYMV